MSSTAIRWSLTTTVSLTTLLLLLLSLTACSGGPPATLLQVEPAPGQPVLSTTTTSANRLLHVTGHVVSPGLYQLPPGSSLAEAILAAGGALPGAELSAINLAEEVRDRQQLYVPTPGESTVGGGAAGGGGPEQPVNINQADLSQLQQLPGIGPTLSQRIVDFRDRNGPFATVEDLLDVSGIGEAKLAELRERVVVS